MLTAHDRMYPNHHHHPRSHGGSARGAQTWARRVHDLLRSEIRNGELPRGSVLVEDRLMRTLDASRNSVREALRQLALSGLVTRSPRAGTRVVDRIIQVSLTDLLPLEYRYDFRVLIVDRRVVPSTDLIRARLGIGDDRAGFVEHLFLSGDEPVGVRAVYHRASVVQPASWPRCPSLGEAFQFVFGRPMGAIESTIDAVPADHKTAGLLGVAAGSPVLLVEQSIHDTDGVCHEFTFTRYRTDRVSLTSLVAVPGEVAAPGPR